ncbi:MAG TPA: hypothetical protein VMU32_07050, partial [Solirubrobacteraceae bacterium]|nr:hypothetical protein [Solirubrobacteraceae bacterium]
MTDPIDPRYLTEVPFGTSSFWVQPWRAYMDTWPAARLDDGLGINFNVGPDEAEAVAQLLQENGFALARREIGWGALSYEDPEEFSDEARIDTVLGALHNHGLRPLILLNANSGAPGPALQLRLETLAAAPAGAQSVRLSPAAAAQVVPGKTGFDDLTFGGAPDDLITAVGAGDVATLSRPLPSELPAGSHRATTLRYAPFQAPTLPDGEPNPVFQETLAGWLSYVATVSRKAASIFGPGGYDLEIWNELGFGSQFLNSAHYYSSSGQEVEGESPASASEGEEASSAAGEERASAEEGSAQENPSEGAGNDTSEGEGAQSGQAETGHQRVAKQIIKTLLAATVAYVRDPANGISPAVGVSDGFASQTPFVSGAQAPPGLTALSKHPYDGLKVFPAEYQARQIVPVDALGQRDTDSRGRPAPFTPTYDSLFPEAPLTATSTETLIRDFAPFTTGVYGDPHGREVGPPGGEPVQKWITEYNLGIGRATPVGPDESTPDPVTLTPADKEHFETKAVLRSLVA